ncbi:MAG: starvation-inducible DNA-binding protein [Saprospiraceae bacterium]|jgi:starvation-inducible DNA-binding protein|tara:strand:- start:1873 stop:2337 length:465 start_codon:yes stop_codon:yes gene_type:complete
MNYLGLKPDELKKTVEQLNRLLANYQIYYQNLRNYHWNITGEHFFDLHVIFEDLYNEAKVNIDEIAERVLTLRMKPMSTLAEYLESADIKELSTEDSKEMVASILSDHKKLISNMREVLTIAGEAGDEGTVDLVGSFLASVEKNSWMLDAWSSK